MATFSDYCQYNVLLAFSCCLLSNLGFLILLLSSFSYILLSNTTIQHICNHNSICYQVIATFLSSLGCAPSLTLPLRHCSNHCISAVITAPLRRSFRTFQTKLARSRKSISKISPCQFGVKLPLSCSLNNLAPQRDGNLRQRTLVHQVTISL